MTALLQLRDVRIAHRIVHELMMGQVVQSVVKRRAEHRKRAQPLARQIVQVAILEQRVVHGLVGQVCQVMLQRTDEDDRHGEHWHVPSSESPAARVNW